MVNAETERNNAAVAAAHANALLHRQNRLEDLRVFEMDIESPTDYTNVITARISYFREMESCEVEGVPVTTPEKEKPSATGRPDVDSHHIVQLNNPHAKNGNGPNDVVAVQFLIRDHDGYYTAFRPITRAHQAEDPSGWYYFYDAALPHFLIKNLRGVTKAYRLPFSSGYGSKDTLQVGSGSMEAMFKSYSQYTPANFKSKDGARQKVVMSTMFFLGEGQRFPGIRKELVRRMAGGIFGVLPGNLLILINQWGTISVCVFLYLLGDLDQLAKLERLYGFVLRSGGEFRLSLLLGPEAHVSFLKYNKKHTINLIKLRQMQQ